MRRIAVLPVALLAAAFIVVLGVVGCSDEAATDRAQPQQSPPASTEQEVAAQPEQQSEQRERPDQAQSAQVADEQQAQPAAVEQAQQQQQQARQQEQQEQQTQQVQQLEAETKLELGEDRPATLLLPRGVDRSEPRPLIVLLHGYGSYAAQAEQYFLFSHWVDEGGFGLLLPEGTIDEIRNRFWNGTPECCDIFGAEPDDVGYIKSLIEEARTIAAFDQVFAVGHSNGGFMAYRLACEEVPGLRGIVSLAGGAFSDPEDCRVPTPLSVLQIHGTKDADVLYKGGRLPQHPDPDRRPAPGAKESVLRWAERAGCDIESAEKLPPIDTDTNVVGSETTIIRFSAGCADGVVAELWTIEGGGHIPFVWNTDFTPGILTWLQELYSGQPAADQAAGADVETHTIGGEREAQLLMPTGRGAEPMPLVLSLHGYQGDADSHDWYFGLSARVVEHGFALITPQGTVDERGYAFWNATDGCCNFYDSEVDDYAWLSGLIAEARELADISGVYVVGYSNGGFMAYRLACDGLDGLVAIASLAGSSFGDADRCADAVPVSVLQVHGLADFDVPYAGTLEYEDGYPGAVELAQRWARRAGCDADAVEELPNLDLEATIDGSETAVQRIRAGCAGSVTIELWSIEAGDHFPHFSDDWPDHLLNWLFNEARAS